MRPASPARRDRWLAESELPGGPLRCRCRPSLMLVVDCSPPRPAAASLVGSRSLAPPITTLDSDESGARRRRLAGDGRRRPVLPNARRPRSGRHTCARTHTHARAHTQAHANLRGAELEAACWGGAE